MPTYQQHPSSFRDPSGFVFETSGTLYRQINSSYAEDYDRLMQSGLYENLVANDLLVSHKEIELDASPYPDRYKTVLPQWIQFISYPYEWCFEQLQDAALLTLEIQKAAMEYGMTLKDATPYNIQFNKGRPIHIDTLSFEKYDEKLPWVAYRQFCENFLYPLLIRTYTPVEVHFLFAAYPSGIGAALVAGMLPFRSKFKFSNWLHLFLPASIKAGKGRKTVEFNHEKLARIIEHLKSVIKSLRPSSVRASVWDDYYEEEILSQDYLESKKQVVSALLQPQDKNIIDLGCNEGVFTRLMEGEGRNVVAIDDNPSSVSKLYSYAVQKESNILPLCIDVMNPPGSGGFGNAERKPFHERMQFDLCLALALLHHLCISRNLPFRWLAEFLSRFTNALIIEFVPKHDRKVQELLLTREDIFPGYTQQDFELAFKEFFMIESARLVPGSDRTVYRMKKRETKEH
jgi:hypothetical protein